MKKVIIEHDPILDDIFAHHADETKRNDRNFIEQEEFEGKIIKSFKYDTGSIIIEFEE